MQIPACIVHDILRRPHQAKRRVGKKESANRHKDTAQQRKGNRRVDCLADPLTASRPVKLGDDNCRTRRKSYKKANQQVRKHRCASADRRQRFLSDKTAYYHRICRIIELLKKSSK